nr:acetyl-coenzyme A synthetase [uncultured bacterium]
MTSRDIKSVLREERRFTPSSDFLEHSRFKPADVEALYRRAEQDNVGFWAEMARSSLEWQKPFTQTLDDSQAPNYRWFTDGKLNVSANCLDRHLEKHGDKTAIIAEGEKGDVRTFTYRQLHSEVCRFANALKAEGVRLGDRVVIYMPMIPEAVVAMQACARIGAIHSVVFGGFSSASLRDRIEDAGATLLITADGGESGR